MLYSNYLQLAWEPNCYPPAHGDLNWKENI